MIRLPSFQNAICRLTVLLLIFLFFGVAYSYAADATGQKGTSASSVEAKAKKEFAYNPVGKRDPFQPLITQLAPAGEKPEKARGPLEKFELGQFRLTAMLLVKGSPRAMVKAPDGKSYIVKPGDKIGKLDGEIVKIETKVVDQASRAVISPDRIVIKEIGYDPYTNKKVVEYRYITM